MSQKEINLHFNLDDEREKRVYFALKKLPNFLNEPDLSKAIILFVDNAVNAIAECDNRTVRCEETLKAILGQQAHGSTQWQ
jgi:intracellular sulfur oxidation DsrE/DsrF family protein